MIPRGVTRLNQLVLLLRFLAIPVIVINWLNCSKSCENTIGWILVFQQILKISRFAFFILLAFKDGTIIVQRLSQKLVRIDSRILDMNLHSGVIVLV